MITDKNLAGIITQLKEFHKHLLDINAEIRKSSSLAKLNDIFAVKAGLDNKIALSIEKRTDDKKPHAKFTEKNPLVTDLLQKLEERLQNLKNIGDHVQNIMEIFTDNTKTAVHEIVKGLQSSVTIVQGIREIFSNVLTLIASFNAAKDIGSFLLDLLPFPFARGGRVPGSGSGDTVPAMLTPGEFVIRKGVVDNLGSAFFDNLNGGFFPSIAGAHLINGMAMGGMVSAPKAPVVNNSFDVHIDRRGDVHVVQKALQKLKSNNRYFGG